MAGTVNDYRDGFSVTAATTATFGPFTLLGGKYAFCCTAPSATISLNILAADGSTYVAVGTSTTGTTSAIYAVVDLPPGIVQVVISSTTMAFSLIRIPYRTA